MIFSYPAFLFLKYIFIHPYFHSSTLLSFKGKGKPNGDKKQCKCSLQCRNDITLLRGCRLNSTYKANQDKTVFRSMTGTPIKHPSRVVFWWFLQQNHTAEAAFSWWLLWLLWHPVEQLTGPNACVRQYIVRISSS